MVAIYIIRTHICLGLAFNLFPSIKNATLYDIRMICLLTAEMIEVQSDVTSKIVAEFEVNDASSVNMMW